LLSLLILGALLKLIRKFFSRRRGRLFPRLDGAKSCLKTVLRRIQKDGEKAAGAVFGLKKRVLAGIFQS
jgi:hypothetical protein